ncbi:MAG: hypothetical protein ACHQ53_17185 [Polyangiales bacterium]
MMRTAALALLWLLAASAYAQDAAPAPAAAEHPAHARKHAPVKPKQAAASKPHAPSKKSAAQPEVPVPAPKADKQPADTKTGHAEATAHAPAEAPLAPSQSSADVRTEGDTQVKVMQFSGLDIEGQLKTPQMLYFLNRMRAEFGRPRLPHRSFMPELQRSTKEDVF